MKENAHMYLMIFYAIANLDIGDPDAKILSKRKCLFRIKLKLYNCFFVIESKNMFTICFAHFQGRS